MAEGLRLLMPLKRLRSRLRKESLTLTISMKKILRKICIWIQILILLLELQNQGCPDFYCIKEHILKLFSCLRNYGLNLRRKILLNAWKNALIEREGLASKKF